MLTTGSIRIVLEHVLALRGLVPELVGLRVVRFFSILHLTRYSFEGLWIAINIKLILSSSFPTSTQLRDHVQTEVLVERRIGQRRMLVSLKLVAFQDLLLLHFVALRMLSAEPPRPVLWCMGDISKERLPEVFLLHIDVQACTGGLEHTAA